MMMRACIAIAMVSAAVALSGCSVLGHNGPPSGALVVSLFDCSYTAAGETVKEGYLRDFTQVVTKLQPGDRLVAEAITENPTATMRFQIDTRLPAYDPWRSNALLHEREVREAKRSLIDQVTGLVRATPATHRTAILDALYGVRKIYQSEAGKMARRRILVLSSDMIEDSARANFEEGRLDRRRIDGLLRRESEDNHLPDLAGVEVWVAGATPDRRQDEARMRGIEAFWVAYFARTGAHLSAEHYGTALLGFGDSPQTAATSFGFRKH